MTTGRAKLTLEGRKQLRARMIELAEDVLPSLRPMLVEDERDERVVADFERLQAEHDRLASVLATAEDIDPASLGDEVVLGSRVSFSDTDGRTRVVRIVDPEEAALDDERISCSSPLALALLGHVAGDQVEVKAPAGVWTAHIQAVGDRS